MNFRGSRFQDGTGDPEINLIPFIDILLVILIFLMLTTTYSRYNELQLNLPLANAEPMRDKPQEIVVSLDTGGNYAVDGAVVGPASPAQLTSLLQQAARAKPQAIVVISADGLASHQSVVSIMEAARNAGLARVTFATQATPGH
ncbi:biopolymer transporter ExbD [Allofranklinella schreckenbergeri]|uniref:Biopolymer transporter ExbD n=1 Tax=Allofranklinella schreckenbergeri TaxID=1076744 RepID=A0A3M6QCC3_9BURK|nr:biopolymer transporter ExbD [Allofranklinella schreckenbergeri]RMX00498.1 biopolymer transporter ExbD [Allofranklinella schreckenbergeri]RMX00788.1 biopolymer transporter ExbD [Allofranklinella schreckenbergeri]RRD38733.1 biopolymer transporter ExbD [Comamonadaceae bacterium OH3737_COT-264]